MLVRPPEAILHREIEEGGLGLVHTPSRCQANLTRTFLQLAVNGSPHLNVYLNTLYRCFVSQELPEDLVKRPPYFTAEFFSCIREVYQEIGDRVLFTTARQWQVFFTERAVTHTMDPATGNMEIMRSNFEQKLGVGGERNRKQRILVHSIIS